MTPNELIERHIFDLRQVRSKNGWEHRHVKCWVEAPGFYHAGSKALKDTIRAWAWIGQAHEREHGRPIGNDSVLGPAWKQMGHSLITFLNADLGGLDGGTLDKLIRDIAVVCHVDLDQ